MWVLERVKNIFKVIVSSHSNFVNTLWSFFAVNSFVWCTLHWFSGVTCCRRPQLDFSEPTLLPESLCFLREYLFRDIEAMRVKQFKLISRGWFKRNLIACLSNTPV